MNEYGFVRTRDLYSVFEKVGFAVAKIIPSGLEIRSYQPYMENFQYSNYVAISSHVADEWACT